MGSPMGRPCGAMEAAVLCMHPDAVVAPYISTGLTDTRFFRSVDERRLVDGIADMTEIVSALIERGNIPSR